METEIITEENNADDRLRLVSAVAVSVYFIYYCFTYTEWHFIDNVNLIIHEAGHTLFMFFGDFFHILGGSFFQIAFPFLFVIYFYKRKEYLSISLLLFWIGQNIINVSVYVSDANVMQLPLIGGEHDWNNILQMTGLLDHAEIIGSSMFAFGVIVIVFAICFSLITSLSRDVPSLFKKTS